MGIIQIFNIMATRLETTDGLVMIKKKQEPTRTQTEGAAAVSQRPATFAGKARLMPSGGGGGEEVIPEVQRRHSGNVQKVRELGESDDHN